MESLSMGMYPWMSVNNKELMAGLLESDYKEELWEGKR
jgi:hypothetical protein